LNQRFERIKLEPILLVAIVVAVLIRWLYVGDRELWYDEVISLLLATGQRLHYIVPPDRPVALANYSTLLQLPSLSTPIATIQQIKPVLQGIIAQEPHPPLFFLAQYVWLWFTGTSEAALRSLNLLLSLISLVGAYGMGRSQFGNRGGLLLAALLGLNPFYWFHSLNMRMYAPTVLWVTLSGWAMLQLCQTTSSLAWKQRLAWSLGLTVSIAAGLLTYYLFILWIIPLAGLAAHRAQWQRWWQYVLCLGGGALLAAPWYFWGLPQQLNNADLERFSTNRSMLDSLIQHTQSLLQVLGIQLVLGDWATSLPAIAIVAIGLFTAISLASIIGLLWRQVGLYRSNGSLMLGLLPLLLALANDILSGKATLAWGTGRSVIFVLPGLLLLVVHGFMVMPRRWQHTAILSLLILYLGINTGDMLGRHRQMLHQVATTVAPAKSTLLVINSKAWGHVLRLAYYLPATASLDLLAAHPQDLPSVLEHTLVDAALPYQQILWMESHQPIWQPPKTATATEQIRQAVTNTLRQHYTAIQHNELIGTRPDDRFTLTVYAPNKTESIPSLSRFKTLRQTAS
jgi:uncharacterized membrane protein